MIATKSKIVTVRCRPWSGDRRLAAHRCMVSPDGTVRVYDDVAGHYTVVHSLTARDEARIRTAAGKA